MPRILPIALAASLVSLADSGRDTPAQPPQTTYWLAATRSDGKSTTYDFKTQVPSFAVPWLLHKTDRGGGKTVTKAIDGKQYTFVRQEFAWFVDKAGKSSMAIQNQLVVEGAKEDVAWKTEPKLASAPEFVAALEAGATVSPGGPDWRVAKVLALQHTGNGPPGLRFTEEIPLPDRAAARMRELAKKTKAGAFYPGTKIPAQVAEFRREGLSAVNHARRDPNARKDAGCKQAVDFSKDTTLTEVTNGRPNGREKLFKHNPTPPYFNDLVLSQKLNQAAQFQAEYQASVRRCSHDGPGDYMGKKMSGFGDRLAYFGYKAGAEGEGCSTSGDGGGEPWGLMFSDTHYRPYFNVGFDTREIGVGVALGGDGVWYYAVIGGDGR